ncbi:hypothetical protein QLL95_gp1059 [Cotonvirus japonicus]|uniref:Uncharacterized protein n=1 Tax=Cotonvirus japonicus TaxID=2811091 RepID=A0ABM7NSC7_9VIRU|nr:hypothetical protein QLL95_gp1059 [Cotonvirus japonicus]BCS83064.1 hypothetical protein [Cotonvirus japonicus]
MIIAIESHLIYYTLMFIGAIIIPIIYYMYNLMKIFFTYKLEEDRINLYANIFKDNESFVKQFVFAFVDNLTELRKSYVAGQENKETFNTVKYFYESFVTFVKELYTGYVNNTNASYTPDISHAQYFAPAPDNNKFYQNTYCTPTSNFYETNSQSVNYTPSNCVPVSFESINSKINVKKTKSSKRNNRKNTNLRGKKVRFSNKNNTQCNNTQCNNTQCNNTHCVETNKFDPSSFDWIPGNKSLPVPTTNPTDYLTGDVTDSVTSIDANKVPEFNFTDHYNKMIEKIDLTKFNNFNFSDVNFDMVRSLCGSDVSDDIIKHVINSLQSNNNTKTFNSDDENNNTLTSSE